MNKFRAIFAIVAAVTVAAFGQDRNPWRTSGDIVEGARGSAVGTVAELLPGRNRIIITPDDSPSDRITIDADAVSTQYNGFGGTINGAPEIFVGSPGFANIREGDRVEVRGTGSSNDVIRAERITLLGRRVAAPATGVGQTRTPTSVSTPTAGGTTPSTAPDRIGRFDGIVRQVNATEGRIVVETDRREILTVRTVASTPVVYQGNTYRVSSLEVGDRIRVEPETGTVTSGGEVRARTITVTASVQETSGMPSREVGGLSGRVTRVERSADQIRVDTGRGQVVRVDLSHATDGSGVPIHARDVQAGDQVSMTGTYSNDVYVATTVRFANGEQPGTIEVRPGTAAPNTFDLGLVTVYATVQTTLANGPQLVLHDTQSGNRVRVYATDDLVIRTKSGGYTTADRLREGDAVVIKAYRDADGNLIAQTIRMR